MVELVIIAVIALGVLLYEVPPLLKERAWKELFAFSILFILGVFLAVAQVLDLDIPTPVDAINLIFTPVSEWVDKTLS